METYDYGVWASRDNSLTFRVDGAAPRIQLTGAWYIWETGEVKVSDEGSGLAGVEIQIRDPQGRWQKVVRSYEASGGSFNASIAWDRTFADGILAPVGTYDVMVTARDLAGNESRETAHILIPAPGVTPSPLPTRQAGSVKTRTQFPASTTAAGFIHHSAFIIHLFPVSHSSFSTPSSSFPLWGAAATAAIAAATGLALAERKRRKDEEARQLAEAQREAARRNAAEEARKAQAYLLAQIAAQQAAQQQTTAHRGEEAKVERMEAAEGAVLAAARTARSQRDEQAYQSYRAGERDAEAIAAEYQARKAVQEYRQGERAEPQPQPKPWRQPAATNRVV